jgi:uncharacterized membrane protein
MKNFIFTYKFESITKHRCLTVSIHRSLEHAVVFKLSLTVLILPILVGELHLNESYNLEVPLIFSKSIQ